MNISAKALCQPVISLAHRRAITTAALMAVILVSSGCGQKGALYLSDASDSQAVIAPTAENTNLDDLDKLNNSNKTNDASDDLSFLDPATEQQVLDDPNNY